MEVHHHPDLHHKRKNIREYLLEFLMIFLAVTMGFIAESLREHIAEHARVREYARSLIHDIALDTVMINETIGYIDYSIKYIDDFTAFMKGKQLSQLRNIDIYSQTILRDGYRPYTWNRASLEQIKNTGSLRYFTNDSLLNRISAYDAMTRHMDEDYRGDQERTDQAATKRSQLVNLNYPESFQVLVRFKKDSVMATEYYRQLADSGPALLTNNLNDLYMLVNQKLVIKYALSVRSTDELPRLIKDGTKLISMLKAEYDLP
jgi:hypothetical protein